MALHFNIPEDINPAIFIVSVNLFLLNFFVFHLSKVKIESKYEKYVEMASSVLALHLSIVTLHWRYPINNFQH